MKWAKKLKTKNGQNISSGPFSHDVAQLMSMFVGQLLQTVFIWGYDDNLTLQLQIFNPLR